MLKLSKKKNSNTEAGKEDPTIITIVFEIPILNGIATQIREGSRCQDIVIDSKALLWRQMQRDSRIASRSSVGIE